MKKAILPILAVFTLSTMHAQNGDALFREDKVTVATMLFDFGTYSYDSLNISYYDCNNCKRNQFQIKTYYQSPGDFGSISYSLSPSEDTFFHAGIVWMGRGEVAIPAAFQTDSLGQAAGSTLKMPADLQTLKAYFPNGQNDTSFYRKRDSVWKVAAQQQLVHDFLNRGGKAAIMLWSPTVGAFDPRPAKWVLFLYYADTDVSTQLLHSSFSLYPNPANSVIHLQTDKTMSHYRIINSVGQTVDAANIVKPQLNLSALPKGTYLLRVTFSDGTLGYKRLVKN